MTDPDPYRCAICGAVSVVPSLARDCEKRHEEDATACRDGTA